MRTCEGAAETGMDALKRWYMYWPSSTNRDMVALPPDPMAVPGLESHCTVSIFSAVGASVLTLTEMNRWLSREVNHSDRSTVRMSVLASAWASAAMVEDRWV